MSEPSKRVVIDNPVIGRTITGYAPTPESEFVIILHDEEFTDEFGEYGIYLKTEVTDV